LVFFFFFSFILFEFVLNDHLVVSISSAVLSRGTKWSVFALYRGRGFTALAGRGAAWKTDTPLSDRGGGPLTVFRDQICWCFEGVSDRL